MDLEMRMKQAISSWGDCFYVPAITYGNGVWKIRDQSESWILGDDRGGGVKGYSGVKFRCTSTSNVWLSMSMLSPVLNHNLWAHTAWSSTKHGESMPTAHEQYRQKEVRDCLSLIYETAPRKVLTSR